MTDSGSGAGRDGPGSKNILILSEKVSDLLAQQRYGEAAKCCDKILAIDPSNIKTLEEREFALMRDRQYADMIKACGRALERRPDDVGALSDMGLGLVMAERVPEGDKALDRALAHDPGHLPTLWRKALARSNQKEYESAISWLDQALAICPGSSLACKRKGDALSSLGRYNEAIPLYDRSLRIRPDVPPTLKGKARALHKLGERDKALDFYNKAWEANSKDWEAFSKMVRLMLETKRYEDVILYCDHILNAEPGNADMLLMKAAALSKLGRREIVDYRDTVLELTPWNMDVLWANGAGSQIRGYGDILKYCNAILREQPWNINILWKKGIALSRLRTASESSPKGRTVPHFGTEQAKYGSPGFGTNPDGRDMRPVLMPDTNILYACCEPGNKSRKKTLNLWNGLLRKHVCYVEYTVLAEMRKHLREAPDCNAWEQMQRDIVRSFGPDASAFFGLVGRYSEAREDQLLVVRQFYADMLERPEMSDIITRWSYTKKNNPMVKEKGAQALLKNSPDHNILAFAAFCSKETGAPTTLLTRDSDFLCFAGQIKRRFGVKVSGT